MMSTTGTWTGAFALLAGAMAIPAAATGTDSGDAVSTDRAGPPVDRPGPVPAFVDRILGTIRAFVGSLNLAVGQVG